MLINPTLNILDSPIFYLCKTWSLVKIMLLSAQSTQQTSTNSIPKLIVSGQLPSYTSGIICVGVFFMTALRGHHVLAPLIPAVLGPSSSHSHFWYRVLPVQSSKVSATERRGVKRWLLRFHPPAGCWLEEGRLSLPAVLSAPERVTRRNVTGNPFLAPSAPKTCLPPSPAQHTHTPPLPLEAGQDLPGPFPVGKHFYCSAEMVQSFILATFLNIYSSLSFFFPS